MTKRSRSVGLLPPELARKISPWMVNIAEMTGPVGKTALITAMALSLYGPEDHNGFLLLFGPWLCPTLIACCLSAILARRRFRIYQGSPYSQSRFVDTGEDPVVMRLADIFNSTDARRRLWQETLKISSILFVILWTAVLFLRNPLNWAYPSPENQFFWTARAGVPGVGIWPGIAVCSIFAFLAISSDYHRWCLTTWAKRESESSLKRP
jgi:hypothetical protein